MPSAAGHRDDPVPRVDPLPGLIVRRDENAAFMAALERRGRAEAEMARRFADVVRARAEAYDAESVLVATRPLHWPAARMPGSCVPAA